MILGIIGLISCVIGGVGLFFRYDPDVLRVGFFKGTLSIFDGEYGFFEIVSQILAADAVVFLAVGIILLLIVILYNLVDRILDRLDIDDDSSINTGLFMVSMWVAGALLAISFIIVCVIPQDPYENAITHMLEGLPALTSLGMVFLMAAVNTGVGIWGDMRDGSDRCNIFFMVLGIGLPILAVVISVAKGNCIYWFAQSISSEPDAFKYDSSTGYFFKCVIFYGMFLIFFTACLTQWAHITARPKSAIGKVIVCLLGLPLLSAEAAYLTLLLFSALSDLLYIAICVGIIFAIMNSKAGSAVMEVAVYSEVFDNVFGETYRRTNGNARWAAEEAHEQASRASGLYRDD